MAKITPYPRDEMGRRLVLHRSQSQIDDVDTITSYGADVTAITLRAVELSIATDARDDLRDYWKIMPHRHAVLEGRRLFVAGIPRMEDEHDAIVQICRVFLREGFDLKHVNLLKGLGKPDAWEDTEDYHYAYVDLMHEADAVAAIHRLDGVIRYDCELLVSQAGLTEELMVGPLPGYQPRRKQVVEVRKLFKGFELGEISLFCELEPDSPQPGEDLFEPVKRTSFYFCSVRLADVDKISDAIQQLHRSIWAGRQIFVKRPKRSPPMRVDQSSLARI